MPWLQKISQNIYQSVYNDAELRYPVSHGSVDGLSIIDDVPNFSSISASLGDESNYDILKGIRIVRISDVLDDPKSWFYAANDFKRFKSLAQEISITKQIKPVIVVLEKEGPYVLEGAHRCAALFELKIPNIPALVVVDYSGYN